MAVRFSCLRVYRSKNVASVVINVCKSPANSKLSCVDIKVCGKRIMKWHLEIAVDLREYLIVHLTPNAKVSAYW